MNSEVIFGWEIADSDQFVHALIKAGFIDDIDDVDELNLVEIVDFLQDDNVTFLIGGDHYSGDLIPYIGILCEDDDYEQFQHAYKTSKESLAILERIFKERPTFMSVVIDN